MQNHDHRESLTFSLLGPVRAWRGSAELGLGSPQQRTTLAMLLLREGAVVTLDELITGMWGEDPPRSAVSTIRTYISRLRAVFEQAGAHSGTRFDSISGGYSLLTPRDGVDLTLFRWHAARGAAAARNADWSAAAAAEYRAAMGLCSGLPLVGALGPYVRGQRVRLQQLVLAAHIDLLNSQINLGQHREVLPELTAMVAELPLWEDVQAMFMTALYGSGRVAEALESYRRTRRMLVDELGIEPGDGLRQVHQRILANDPSLGCVPAPVTAPTGQLPASRRRPHVRLARRRLSFAASAVDTTPGRV